jgi:prepilin-type N-terminal cleavage/methylation domain-containing protein
MHMLRSFTFIEWMIVVAVIGVVAATVAVADIASDRTSCRAGYVFVHGSRGQLTQVLDAQGHGIPCGS